MKARNYNDAEDVLTAALDTLYTVAEQLDHAVRVAPDGADDSISTAEESVSQARFDVMKARERVKLLKEREESK